MRSRTGSPAFLPRRFVFRIHKSASQLVHSSASCRGTAYFCIRRVVFICVFWACPSVLTLILPECQSVAQRESPTVNSQQSTVGTTKFSGLWLGTWLCGGLAGAQATSSGFSSGERELSASGPVRAAPACQLEREPSLGPSKRPTGGAWVRFLSDRDPPWALRSQVPERTQRQVQRAQKKQVTAEAGHRRSRAASSRPTITHRPEPLQASRRGRNN
ncbi:hypothetical protein BKA56DRAFT_41298 [Ilyonectria sp. MPI-CAGE-AT-0026]|nr:hypothetical protein BKA56DRAFT_41298 [Ilyonectria sp. MPI-CAGE-AT-0026]